MYRLTITERQELLREERQRRSVARLVQVRQQASRAADRTRQRVQAESARQLAKVKQLVASEYAADKENKLQHLEAEYSACLRQVGAAHLAAARQPDLTAPKRLLAAEQQEVAEARQQAALRRIRDSQRELHEDQRRCDTLRELNRALERVRADRVAQEGHQRRMLENRHRMELQRQKAAVQSSAASGTGAVVFQSAFRPRVSFRDDTVQTRPRARCRRTRALQTTDRGPPAGGSTTCRGNQTRALGRDKKTGTRFPEPEPAVSSGRVSVAAVPSSRSGGSTSLRTPQASGGGGGGSLAIRPSRSDTPTVGTSSVSLTDVPHSESALTPSELQRQLSSASTGVPLRSETRPPPKQYQVRRERSGYDARAAAQEQEQLQRVRASNERLRQQGRELAASERGRQAQRRMSARSEYARLLSELERVEADERRERRQGGTGTTQQLARATASLMQEAGGLPAYEERQRRLNQLFEDALLLAADAESEGDRSAELVTPARDLAAEFDRHGRHVAELMAAAPPTAVDGVAAGVQAVNVTRSQLARSSLSAGPPGTWTAAAEEEEEGGRADQSRYSSVSGAVPTSQWPTDESAAGAGPRDGQRASTQESYGAEESMVAEQHGYNDMYGQEMYSQEMYGREDPQMYGQRGQQTYQQGGVHEREGHELHGQELTHGQERQDLYGDEGQQMYEHEGGMYGQANQEMFGQEGQIHEQDEEGGQETHGEEYREPCRQGIQERYGLQGQPLPGQESDQYPDSGGQAADETAGDRPVIYVGSDGIFPVGDRTAATSPDVSSLRTADLSSLHTSDGSTVRSSELSALVSSGAGAPAGQTFDSTTTAYRAAPGDPGDPALAADLLQGAPAAVGSRGELRQYVSQLLEDSRERLSQLSMPGSSPSTVYGSASVGSLSRSGAADATFATAASPGDSSADVADGAAGAAGATVAPERSGTSGVYSEEPSQSAAAAASDAYMQRYSEVMQKLSEVQQRRDELMRSYSSMADELRGSAAELAAAPSISGSVRPRPPPSLSRGAVLGSAPPHELSTILEQSRTTPQEGSADPAGVTVDSGGGRPADVTSTGSLLSRTGGRTHDDTLSQLSNLASSQEYFSQESPRAGSVTAAVVAAVRPGALDSSSEVSLRSSALERALEASREAIRSVSGTGFGGGAQPLSPSGKSSPDVGRIISKLGMKSRSGPLADPRADQSSSSSGSVSAQRQASRAGRASGDELRRKVLSKQAAQSSSSVSGPSSGSSPGSSSSSSASSVGSGSPSAGGSSGLLVPLDLSAAPAPDSSLDTDKFEAGVAAGGVQSTPMKRGGPAPEGGPVAGLGGAVSMRPQDMTLPPTSDED